MTTEHRPRTLVNTLKSGTWRAARDKHLLDEDLLPSDPPGGGPSSRYVWGLLRDLQAAYQDRDADWASVPRDFEALARSFPVVALLEESAQAVPVRREPVA